MQAARIQVKQLAALAAAVLVLSVISSPSAHCGESSVKEAVHASASSASAKPMVVAVYDDDCSYSCSIVRPMIQELSQSYQGKVDFFELNVNEKKMAASTKRAGELGVSSFFSASAPYIPCVGIFSAQKSLIKEIPAAKPKSAYIKYIEQAIKAKK